MDDSKYTVADFKVGQRVELHPCTDAWMFGDRFGEVVALGWVAVHVKMDRSGKTRLMAPRLISRIIP